ncbi:hypothetical protein Tco_0052242 [Tanacetum coccineum]
MASFSGAETQPFEAPLSLDYAPVSDADTELLEVPASPDYIVGSNIESEPPNLDPKESFEEDPYGEDLSEEDPMEDDEPLLAQAAPTLLTQPPRTIYAHVIQLGQEVPLRRPYRLHPNGTLMMLTPRKRVCASFTLSPSIKAGIIEEIAAPPHKRGRSSPPLSPPLLPSSASSSSPSPSVSLPPHVMLPPRKRFMITLPQQDTTAKTMTEAIIPARIRKKSATYHWTGEIGSSRGSNAGSPGGASGREFEAMKQDTKGLHGSIEAIQKEVDTLQGTLQTVREQITDLEFCLDDSEERGPDLMHAFEH